MLEEMKRQGKIRALKHLVSQMHKKRFGAEGDDEEEKAESPSEAMREEVGMNGNGAMDERADLLEGNHKAMDHGESVNEPSEKQDGEDDFDDQRKSFMKGKRIGPKPPLASKTVIMISASPKKGKKY